MLKRNVTDDPTDDPGHPNVITRRGAKHAHRIMSSAKTSHSLGSLVQLLESYCRFILFSRLIICTTHGLKMVQNTRDIINQNLVGLTLHSSQNDFKKLYFHIIGNMT